ncbi:hypothetical protein F4808DRAFT_457564 [Astrocystis sublimbata]|nr:hypothetical protein F4808DRAFT_457564 [Astrocystis sublimbata]
MSSNEGTSRQRNCTACVRSKRRCDKGQPACGRCIKQRFPCVYGGRRQAALSPGASASAPAFSLDCLADPTLVTGPFMPIPDGAPTAIFGGDLELLPDATVHMNGDFSTLLAPTENHNFLPDPWASPFTALTGIPPEQTFARKDYSKMTPMCDDFQPWQLADPSSKAAFTINVLKQLHVKFARNSCTLYMHRYLYKDKMPRSILQAFSMCLLYINQTEANRAMVLRALHENITELKTTDCSKTLVPQEKLARVHALMFYQTIRMFDGDISLGQQVEDDMALLASWNRDLCKIKDNLDSLVEEDKVASEHPPESWERWIFAESLRRTCIMCICLQKVWGMLKLRLKASNERLLPLLGIEKHHDGIKLLTHNSRLWKADNSFDFFQAWKEQPFYIISTFNFQDFLKAGTGDDLDEFSFYFLTLYFGVNEIKTFCHDTSGHFLALT